MIVKALRNFTLGKETVQRGQTLDLPTNQAMDLAGVGLVQREVPKAPKKAAKKPAPKKKRVSS